MARERWGSPQRVDDCYPTEAAAAVGDLRARGVPVVTTTNPLILDEFAPEDAYLVTRGPDGVPVATRFADMPQIRARLAVYGGLGAVWVSYADGEDEAPLLRGEPRPDSGTWGVRRRAPEPAPTAKPT